MITALRTLPVKEVVGIEPGPGSQSKFSIKAEDISLQIRAVTKHWYRSSVCRARKMEEVVLISPLFYKTQKPREVDDCPNRQARERQSQDRSGLLPVGFSAHCSVVTLQWGSRLQWPVPSSICPNFKPHLKTSRQDYRQWLNVYMLSNIKEKNMPMVTSSWQDSNVLFFPLAIRIIIISGFMGEWNTRECINEEGVTVTSKIQPSWQTILKALGFELCNLVSFYSET